MGLGDLKLDDMIVVALVGCLAATTLTMTVLTFRLPNKGAVLKEQGFQVAHGDFCDTLYVSHGACATRRRRLPFFRDAYRARRSRCFIVFPADLSKIVAATGRCVLPMVVLVSVAVVVMLVAAAVVVVTLVAAVAAGLGPHLDDLRAALLQTLRRRLLRRRLRLDLDDLRPLGLDLDAAHAPPALGRRHPRMRGVGGYFTTC
jgi:hypothetical protein